MEHSQYLRRVCGSKTTNIVRVDSVPSSIWSSKLRALLWAILVWTLTRGLGWSILMDKAQKGCFIVAIRYTFIILLNNVHSFCGP